MLLRKLLNALIRITAISLLGAGMAQGATLTVKIEGIETIVGDIFVAVYKDAASYGSDDSLYSATVKVSRKTETVVFSEVPEGSYALKMYHDANENQELDTNFVGIPKEGYSFSNNGGRFGPPSFESASFDVSAATTISIVMK